jgi:ribonuclease PH
VPAQGDASSGDAELRASGRAVDELRTVEMLPHWVTGPDGNVLIKQGGTWVLCTVLIVDRLPAWRRGQGLGWLSATYNMLPGSTAERTERERRGARGRTLEIERMIGRALRTALDLGKVGERTLHVDCDVLQADGGTRTASVTGGWLALALATRALMESGRLREDPLKGQVAAVSVGVVGGTAMLDLDYSEDVRADTDMNVVMTDGGRYVEVQGTAEGEPFAAEELRRMLELAEAGTTSLLRAQTEVLDVA